MKQQLILGLHAEPRAGKDTFALLLAGVHLFPNWNGTVSLAYADGIYEDLCEGYGVERADFSSTQSKTVAQDRYALIHCGIPNFRIWAQAKGLDLFEPRTSRWVMQTYGTDYMHGIDKLHWVKQTLDRASQIPDGTSIVITDVRHPDTEIGPLRTLAVHSGRRYFTVEIVRDWGESSATSHSSDRRIPAHLIDLTITNERDQPELMIQQLASFLKLKGIL